MRLPWNCACCCAVSLFPRKGTVPRKGHRGRRIVPFLGDIISAWPATSTEVTAVLGPRGAGGAGQRVVHLAARPALPHDARPRNVGGLDGGELARLVGGRLFRI